jgi:hypothetical protein
MRSAILSIALFSLPIWCAARVALFIFHQCVPHALLVLLLQLIPLPKLRDAISAWLSASKRGDAATANEQLKIAKAIIDDKGEAAGHGMVDGASDAGSARVDSSAQPAATGSAFESIAAPAVAPTVVPVPDAVPSNAYGGGSTAAEMEDDEDELMEAVRRSLLSDS